MKKTNLIITYIVILFFAIPYFHWLIIGSYNINDHNFGKWYDFMVWFRIFMTGPGLIIMGIILVLSNKWWLNKIMGLLSVLLGLYIVRLVMTSPI
jgi:hypothetical protein